MADVYDTLVSDYSFPSAPVGRAKSIVKQDIEKQKTSLLSTANTASNECTSIAQFGGTATSGNFTLTVNAPLAGYEYTTANIAYNATDSDIETALDTASPAGVADGDISVTAGTTDFTDGEMVFDCAGALANTPVIITITDADLAGTSPTVGAVSRVTVGNPGQAALQALFDLKLVSGTVPNCGEASSDWTKGTGPCTPEQEVSLETIYWLSQQLYVEQGITDNREAVDALYDFPAALHG